jgi:Domain of unknown function (DUF4149)
MTTLGQITLGIDMLAMSLAIGATAWFFFIQSPILHKAMKREQFVPLQIRLSKVLFSTLLVVLVIVVAASAVNTASLLSISTLTGLLALVAGAINRFVVFPRAMVAGGQSIRLGESTNETSQGTSFLADGAGRSATRMHRVVVVFVLLMVAGLVAHGVVTVL